MFFFFETIKVIASCLTLFLAITNLGFVIYFFWYKDRKETVVKGRDLRIAAFNNLILNYTLPHFHRFFDDIDSFCAKLRSPNQNPDVLKKVEEEIQGARRHLRQAFIDALRVVDTQLYDKVLGLTDGLIDDNILPAIFDAGINLSDAAMYSRRILEPLSITRTDILRHLFAYDGQESAALARSN